MKTRVPAKDAYRIDHTDLMGEYAEWYYNHQFPTRESAQEHIDYMNPKYRDKLKIVKFHIPEHDAYHLGTVQL